MLEIGSVIDGKYKILNVVGKGGMSVVYLAMNERANKQWAIKEVRKDGVQNYEVVKQNLIVETELLKKFNHPNLPSIVDVIDGDGTFYIVMDYIEGNPLSKAIETSGAQPQEMVIEWAKQLCDVLGYLHSRKPPIIYRDMKPSNVMLKPDGTVMLIDFGTAREFKSNSVADTTCLGTQGYAAPEQFGGQGQTDARTDIYCLGATMYHLVTGHNPCTPPYEMYPIRQWNPMLSSGLEEIILKCIQKNPDDRYQSCAELLYALDHYTDLDIENKKVQSFKWNTFMSTMIIMIVMLVGSIGFGTALKIATAGTYDSLIAQAHNASDNAKTGSKPQDYYMKAIDLDPRKLTAYQDLVTYFGSDNQLSRDEYSFMSNLMNDSKNYIKTVSDANRADFADTVAYDYGQYMFFSYVAEPLVGKQNSKYWFDIVIENAEDPEHISRAETLKTLAESYANIGKLTPSGDQQKTYSEYFADLSDLTQPDIDQTQNISIALSIYRYVAMEVYNKSDLFIGDGISKEEIESLLSEIKRYTAEIKNNPMYNDNKEYKKNYDKSIKTIDDLIEKTKALISNTEIEDETN